MSANHSSDHSPDGLPTGLRSRLEAVLDTRIASAAMVRGGEVARAAKIETTQRTVFVKWKEDAPSGFFAAEADGLERLRRTETLRIPQVLTFEDWDCNDDSSIAEKASRQSENVPPFLVLEWLEARQGNSQAEFTRSFAEGLAAMHRNAASPDGRFGLDVPNFLGSQPQDNAPSASWQEFYRDCRILPQMERARQNGLLPAYRERLITTTMERIDEWMADMPARAVLVHGDLWSGNFLQLGDQAALIDPAVYYADREVELAYIELFGGFPPGFVAAYDDVYSLDSGYSHRRPLHQLYPLLIHLNHFGETYGPMVEQACLAYEAKR